MKVVQCDRCKKIIDKGELVRFEHKQFEPNCEEKEWNSKNLDLCNSCYNRLLIFLRGDTSKQELV